MWYLDIVVIDQYQESAETHSSDIGVRLKRKDPQL